MTQFLPPNLLALFAPRDPIPYLVPTDKLPHEKKRVPYSGVGQFVSQFEDPKDTPLPTKSETREERKERKRKERAELQAYKIEQGIAVWDPQNSHKATSDPYKTLFVSRINYDTSESKLRREFEIYGPIKKIYMVYDKNNGKPRGYAFVEYEHERDMHGAYKHGDGKKIDGRRVLVDVERGRTVKGWLPRRLGGGLGNTRRAKAPGGEPLDDATRGVSRERSEQRRNNERDRGGNDRDRDRRHSRSRDKERNPRESSGRRSRSRSAGRERKEREERPPRRDRERGGGREDRDKSGREERDKSGREDRGDKSGREDRDKSGREDRGDKSGREDRGDKSSREDRDVKVGREDRDKSSREDRSGRGDRGDRNNRDRGDRRVQEVRVKEEPMNDNGDENGEY